MGSGLVEPVPPMPAAGPDTAGLGVEELQERSQLRSQLRAEEEAEGQGGVWPLMPGMVPGSLRGSEGESLQLARSESASSSESVLYDDPDVWAFTHEFVNGYAELVAEGNSDQARGSSGVHPVTLPSAPCPPFWERLELRRGRGHRDRCRVQCR